jgi:hypothetical protein
VSLLSFPGSVLSLKTKTHLRVDAPVASATAGATSATTTATKATKVSARCRGHTEKRRTETAHGETEIGVIKDVLKIQRDGQVVSAT